MNLFTCGMFQMGVFGLFHNFWSVLLLMFQVVCWHQIQNGQTLTKINKVYEVKLWYCLLLESSETTNNQNEVPGQYIGDVLQVVACVFHFWLRVCF